MFTRRSLLAGFAGLLLSVGSLQGAIFSCPCEMPRFTLYADYLYWQAHQEGTEFARTGFNDSALLVQETGRVYQPKCRFESAFRVGAVVDLNCCNWDFFAQYTWFHSKQNRFADNNSYLQPLWSTTLPEFTNLFSTQGTWNGHFNMLDIGWGRTIDCNPCVKLRPYLGLKGTWQTVDLEIVYTQQQPELPGLQQGHIRQRIRNKMTVDGVGVRAGLETQWLLCRGLSLVGNFALSGVCSELVAFRTTAQEEFDPVTGHTIGSIVYGNQRESSCVVLPVFEWQFGLRVDGCVCDLGRAYAFVGWEEQAWLNYSRFIHDTTDSNYRNGNLIFQGVTARVGLFY